MLLPSPGWSAPQLENPVQIVTTRLAPAPVTESESRLVVVQGQPVLLARDAYWVLNERSGRWTRAAWRPRGPIVAAAGDGQRVFLLTTDTGGRQVRDVSELSLDDGAVRWRELPTLPFALESAHADLAANVLHLAGRDPQGALRLLSIGVSDSKSEWRAAPAAPSVEGAVSSLVAQNSALFLTIAMPADRRSRLLRWNAGTGWGELQPLPGQVIDGGARATGQAHVLYLLRDDTATDGARTQLLSFHAITRSRVTLATFKEDAIRSAVGWRNGLIWMQQHADPPAASVFFSEIQPRDTLIGALDWLVIVIYLLAMTGIGLFFYLREKRVSTADFFVGSRSIPFWAAGVSLYATNTSSISYIAIPAKAFETNWQYLTNNLVAIIGLMFVAVWIVPLLRRLDLMSVFQYLEIRFHPVIRTMASALFIIVQIGSRLSVILLLPSLAIATMTGVDVGWCILIMGAVTIAYTALGGMKAVIWTDFVQLFVMFGGALFAIGYIVSSLDGGMGEFLTVAGQQDKMKLLDWSWDLTDATVWGFIFLVLFDVVLTFPKDQVLMQRVLSTKSDREAGRSIWTFAAIMIPGGFMFYLIGTALFVFYQKHPERLNPLMQIDATFPLFIAAELPVGVRGIIVAGILAASMSTLSSIMNSVATLASVDFYERRVKRPDPAKSVRFAEFMTLTTGLVGIAAAWLLSRYDVHSLFDVSIELAGLMGGGFAGAYTLGMFTRRANWQGVVIGIASAIVLTTLAWSLNLVHPYFYLAISILVCIVFGYLASLLFPPPPQSLAGLTIHRQTATELAASPRP